MSGTDCFDLVYQSMQRPQYGAAATSFVYYPFAFALFEVPLASVYQCLYLAGVVLDPTTTAFSCPAYDASYTLAETLGQAPFQQFDFTRVLAGYRRADLVRALALFACMSRHFAMSRCSSYR